MPQAPYEYITSYTALSLSSGSSTMVVQRFSGSTTAMRMQFSSSKKVLLGLIGGLMHNSGAAVVRHVVTAEHISADHTERLRGTVEFTAIASCNPPYNQGMVVIIRTLR